MFVPVVTLNNSAPTCPGEPLADDATRTDDEQHCYVCKQKYVEIHHFYDQLCWACAELNFAKRTETADLRGRVALLTGGRVKIGFQTALKCLRAGARVIVTTRFPRDAAVRFSREEDFGAWGERLQMLQVQVQPEAMRLRDVTLDQVMQATAEAVDSGLLQFDNGSVIGTM